MTQQGHQRPSMVWWGWGALGDHTPLSPSTAALLAQAFGIDAPPATPDESHVPIPPASRLTAEAIAELAAIVGDAHVRTGDAPRARHCRGKSTPDLLRIRAGDLADAPDGVVLPASHDEVLAVLAWCAAARVACVPFGGGTSVVGGLAPERGGFAAVIALDLQRLDALVELDEVSRTARLQPGLRGPQAEALLGARGYTLGHFPQSFEYGSIGGFAATRSSGQASAGYGRFDQLVVGLTIATPQGTWRLGRGPLNAAGPDLRQLVLGSEGAFGVITEVEVIVRPAPQARRYQGWQVGSFAAGQQLLRSLAQAGALPTIARLSDEVETAVGLANAKRTGEQSADGCYVMLGFEGTPQEIDAMAERAAPLLEAAGASQLGEDLGDAWLEGRFHGPYLRDALLDVGGLVETLETTASWRELPAVYDAVREAAVAALTAAGTPPIVLAHISHTYRSGASLYFTVICKQSSDPLAQWAAAKRAISDALTAAGGSITHHHAVGTDHRPWLQGEVGELGTRVLAAVKRELDPAGILNPGVLVATGDGEA